MEECQQVTKLRLDLSTNLGDSHLAMQAIAIVVDQSYYFEQNYSWTFVQQKSNLD